MNASLPAAFLLPAAPPLRVEDVAAALMVILGAAWSTANACLHLDQYCGSIPANIGSG